eukprot:4422683-Heterocapsa_arctica.AAC.1
MSGPSTMRRTRSPRGLRGRPRFGRGPSLGRTSRWSSSLLVSPSMVPGPLRKPAGLKGGSVGRGPARGRTMRWKSGA